MPNNIVNIITANGSDERVKEMFSSIKGERELIDFNLIIPMPENLYNAAYCEWARANWGTKWNAYDSEQIDDYTIKFETAWSGVPELIEVLSERWPDIEFEYMYADEDYGYNTGSGIIKNGYSEMYYPNDDSEDAWQIYLSTHEDMRDDFEYKNGAWRCKDF